MKILIFYHAMNQLGGAPRVYAQMANHWAENKNYSVTIVNHFGKERSAYGISPKVRIMTACPIYRGNPNKAVRSLLSPLLLPKLLFAIRKTDPDVIIINNAPYYGLLLGTFAAKLTRKPFIIWKHSGTHMASSFLYKIARKLCFPKADAVVALTKGDMKLSPNKRTFVIKNPYIPPSGGFAHIKKEKIVLNVGRLVKQKSLDHLLRAWKIAQPQIPEWKLQIVGDGDLRTSLEKYAETLGIAESVLFEGASADVDGYYEKASIFAMSSMHEGLPMTLIEALGHGLPLISYDCPYGPADIIDHNQNGLLVENGNVGALAGAIVTLADNENLRSAFAANAPDKIKEFSIESVSQEWDNLFKEIIAPAVSRYSRA